MRAGVLRGRVRSRGRQGKPESRSTLRKVGYADLTVMRLDDRLADGKTQPGPLRPTVFGGAVELLKDALLLARLDAGTAVFDSEQNLALPELACKAEGSACGG